MAHIGHHNGDNGKNIGCIFLAQNIFSLQSVIVKNTYLPLSHSWSYVPITNIKTLMCCCETK